MKRSRGFEEANVTNTRRLGAALFSAGALVVGGCGGSSDGDSSEGRLSPVMVASVAHSDLVFDASRSLLYASSEDPAGVSAKTRLVAIDVATGTVREILPPSIEGPPIARVEVYEGTLALSANARALYFVTMNGKVSRLDLATGQLDYTVAAPAGARETLKAGSVVASRTEDTLAFVMLYDDVGALDDAVAALRGPLWLPGWVDLQSQQNISAGEGKLGLSADETELFPNPPLQRISVSASGPSVFLKRGLAPTSGWVPQPVAQGTLVGTHLYDATTLELLYAIADASHCAPLPSRVRVVCTGYAQQTGHALFVFDLRTRMLTAERAAGFESGSPFVRVEPMLIRSVGIGKVAISYGHGPKPAIYGPNTVAVYRDPAFE